MAHIKKGFRVQLVDGITPNANVIADLGPTFIFYGAKISTMPTTDVYTDYATYLNQYISDMDQSGGPILAGVHSESSWQTAYSNILRMVPGAVDRTFSDLSYSGKYIRLLNDSGYYAVSDRLTGAAASSWDLKNPDGSNAGTAALTGSYSGDSSTNPDIMVCSATITGDRITAVNQRAYIRWSRNQFYIVRTNDTSYNSYSLDWLNHCTQYVPPPTDPYSQGGESDVGGGTGDFDGTSVDVDFASLPTLSAVDTGFITLYNPSLAQLQSLASYMWSGLFDIDTFKKLFADPMQAILGLSIVPGPVPSGATQNVRIGNIDSGVAMTKAATQYIDIDCGTLNVEEFWGAYLDYEPYTKAEIFLPFIGVHQIAIDDIMSKPVHIKYHIDLLSGGCACEIKCGGSVLYTFIGSCAVSIPVTGNDWTNLLNGVLSAASAIGTMVATGGAAAPAATSTIASAAVNSLKPSIEKSGSIAGAGGLLAGKVPVLILTRPRQALPGDQNKFTGYPAFITRSLGALSGYTEVHSIRLSGIDGTESEIDEIEELLKGGVIL